MALPAMAAFAAAASRLLAPSVAITYAFDAFVTHHHPLSVHRDIFA